MNHSLSTSDHYSKFAYAHTYICSNKEFILKYQLEIFQKMVDPSKRQRNGPNEP